MTKEEMRRKRSNQVVLFKLFTGDSLAVIDIESMSFPPRHKIEKSKDALEFIKKKKPKIALVD